MEEYGYGGDIGHRKLINLQNLAPDFGIQWQQACLESRSKVIKNRNNFVMDRSPIDNAVYMMTQVSHNMNEDQILTFLHRAIESYRELTHIILLPVNAAQTNVEDNGSRVSNLFFQQYISRVFDDMFNRYFDHKHEGPKVIRIDTWDLDLRKKIIDKHLN